MRVMTPSQRKSKSHKTNQTYAYIPFRPTPLMDRRLRSLAEKTGQTIGALIRDCVAAQIDKLEAVKSEKQTAA